MKKHVLLICLLVGTGVLFSYKTHAAIFQSNINNGEQGCIGKALNGGCLSEQQGLDHAEAVVWQQLDFGSQSVPVESVQIITAATGVVGGGGHGANTQALFMDQEHWDAFEASGYLASSAWGIATSTMIALAGTSTFATSTFTFTPNVTQTPGHEYVAVVFKIVSDPENFYKPQYAVTYQSFPPSGYGQPWLLGAGAQLPGTYAGANTQNQRDLRIRINSGVDYPLEITYPLNNSTVTDDPVTISGTCENPLELYIYNGVTYASSTTAFGSSLLCTANTFSYSTALDQGYWNVFASSTDGTDGIVFYRLAQTLLPPDITDFDTNPFAGAEGSDFGFWSFLFDDANKLLNRTRPYSYVPQIIAALYASMDNATSADWFAPWSVTTTVGIKTMPGLGSGLFDNIPSSFKSGIRSISTIAFVLAFIWYLWSLRHKII